MRKQILSILSVVFAIASANAQVATTYRGAFAPAPTPMWTDNWVNWDPNNAYYPASNVNVSGHLTGSVVWTKNNTYKLVGIVSLDSLATLTIEPGTVIRGDEQTAGSSLVVRRGAQLIANGTPCNPIVFTSNKAAGARAKGDWGGIILLGRGLNNLGTQVSIEGIDPVNGIFHGGSDNTDNSGSLKYVRIEFAGYQFQVDNEINGLTLGSIGSGTTIDFVQVSFSNDDSYEWFGGAVNCSHLVAYRGLDDDWDTDNGFSGLVQFGLSVKDPQISDNGTSSTSEGWESDNDATGTTNLPKTSARFYNITQVGAFRCGSNAGAPVQPSATAFRRGARIRRQSEQKIYNSILMNNWIGYFFNGANTLAEFRNNVIAMDTSITFVAPYAGFAKIGEDVTSTNFIYNQVPNNTVVLNPCNILVNAWDFLNPDYRPNSAAGGGVLAGCDLTPGFSIGSPLFTANQSNDFLVNVTENNVGASNGVVTVRLIVPGGWTVSVPGIASLPVFPASTAGTNGSNSVGAYTNGKWSFSRNASSTQVIATFNGGEVISQNATTVLGFVATRKATTPNGTNQNLSGSVTGGSDNNAANNSKTITFGAN